MNERMESVLTGMGVDIHEIMERFSQNEKLYFKFLLKFPSDDNFQKIIPALKAGEYQSALMAAHTLKGISGNLGLKRLYQSCSEIVLQIREEDYETAEKTYSDLETAYTEVLDGIRECSRILQDE